MKTTATYISVEFTVIRIQISSHRTILNLTGTWNRTKLYLHRQPKDERCNCHVDSTVGSIRGAGMASVRPTVIIIYHTNTYIIYVYRTYIYYKYVKWLITTTLRSYARADCKVISVRGLLNKRREERRKCREKKALRIKMTTRGECAYHTTAVTTFSCT